MSNTTVFLNGMNPADDRAPLTYILLCTLLPLTALVVALRFYFRIVNRHLGPDDWVTLLSLVLVCVTALTQLAELHFGMGRHKVYLTADDYMNYMRAFYVDVVFYNCALASIKLQVLLQYYRLFDVRLGLQKILLWVTIIICFWNGFTIVSAIFSCVPVDAFWDHSVAGKCFPIVHLAYTHAAGHIVTDVVIFALPIRMLWQMKLPKAQRISLVAVFGFGFFTCALSVVRIFWLNIDRGVDDDSYYNIEAASWSIGELSCGMIVTCLPTLRPMFFRTKSTKQVESEKEFGWAGPPTIGGGRKNISRPMPVNFDPLASNGQLEWADELEKGYATASLETVRSARRQ